MIPQTTEYYTLSIIIIVSYAIIILMHKDNYLMKQSSPKNIYLPKKKSFNTKDLRKKRTKSKIVNYVKNGKRGKKPSKFLSKLLLLILTVGSIIGVIYLSILFVTNLRKNTSLLDIETGEVVGMKDVPIFPNSSFVFEENIDDETVREFLSKGNSAYRLPPNSNLSEVFEYYKTKLPEFGWNLVNSVPEGSETMKSGYYWIKDEKGLRIYSKYNDIWYESITTKEAQEGLAERVKEEVERDLLLATEGVQDLLPDFPWVLQVPKEYIISYSVSEFNNLRKMDLKEIGGEERISLTPIANYSDKGLDYFLDLYIELINKQSSSNMCGIARTELAYTEYAKALRGTMSCSEGTHQIAVIVDPYRGVVYILDGVPASGTYFETVFTDIRPLDNKRT